MTLSPEARAAQREYKRRWREANPGKQEEYTRDFWERKALQYAEEEKMHKEENACE